MMGVMAALRSSQATPSAEFSCFMIGVMVAFVVVLALLRD